MNFWQDKKVFVTGSEGLIGKPLVRMLREHGALVFTYDLAFGDNILDMTRLKTDAEGLDICFHLAAVSGVEASRRMGYDAYNVNVMGAVNVLEACLQAGSYQAVVTASSNHVYGKQDTFPVPETAPLHQLDTYSATKIAADYLARSYAHNYKLPVAVVRNTNCYGPTDPHHDHIIPGTILSVLKGECPIIRSDGQRRKAYLYVDDVVAAYLAVAEWMAVGGTPGEVFNVTTGNISVLELVRLILRVMGREDLEPTVLGEPNDQQDEDMDDALLRTVTGWCPAVSLEAGIRATADGLSRLVRV